MDPTFVDDQLIAASHATRHRLDELAGHPSATGGSRTHPSEPEAIALLAASIERGALFQCRHTSTGPAPLTWSPGMPILGCGECWATQDRLLVDRNYCYGCAVAQPPGEGRVAFAAGPVAIFLTLCEACRQLPAGPGLRDRMHAAQTKLADVLQSLWDAT